MQTAYAAVETVVNVPALRIPIPPAESCWRKKVLKYFFIPSRDLIFVPL